MTVLDPAGLVASRVRRVLARLPAGEGAACPMCDGALERAELVDAHDTRHVRFLDLFTEPSDGSAVEFVPCGCHWDSDTDERMFIVEPLGEALGFRLAAVDEDAPGLVRGRARYFQSYGPKRDR